MILPPPYLISLVMSEHKKGLSHGGGGHMNTELVMSLSNRRKPNSRCHQDVKLQDWNTSNMESRAQNGLMSAHPELFLVRSPSAHLLCRTVLLSLFSTSCIFRFLSWGRFLSPQQEVLVKHPPPALQVLQNLSILNHRSASWSWLTASGGVTVIAAMCWRSCVRPWLWIYWIDLSGSESTSSLPSMSLWMKAAQTNVSSIRSR